MEAYRSFAQVYDLFMDNVDYDSWSSYLIGLLKRYGVDSGLVLELGCGTGNMTERLARAGYDMIGVDCSEDMLEIAQEKKLESGLDILYLEQDMREFELYGTARAVVSVCDSLNYILDPGGIFLFDLNTVQKYREIGESVIAENREESSFIWENDFDEESKINEYQLTIFLREGKDRLYRKYEELHCQRGYSLEKIRALLEEAGLEFLDVFEAFTDRKPGEKSERIYFAAREKGKSRNMARE